MDISRFTKPLIAATLAALTFTTPAGASAKAPNAEFEARFDSTLGTQVREPQSYQAVYDTAFERTIARLADGSDGRIGVAAFDMKTGREVAVLGDQRFPMASTSKIAIAATYLEGVDQGRWSLSSEWPLMIPTRSAKFSSTVAPVRKGNYMSARELIDLMITRSSNPATDAILAAVGGPSAVNDWARRSGIEEFTLTRDIATLVRDDGEVDPAMQVDYRDSATPMAMVQLLTGLYQGKWLTPNSRSVIIDAMERCRTGRRRIPALMPASAKVAHKTGSLNNTSSDVGVLTAPDGRRIAVAIYVTGQGSRSARENRIASIARALYDGFTTQGGGNDSVLVDARYN
jgi:beta-lactamase class A